MKWRYRLLAVALILSVNVLAKNEWQKGVIILKNDQVLVGEIQHSSQFNIVQIKTDENIRTFSAFQVKGFNFNDRDLGLVRSFVSVPYEDANRFVDTFFEVVMKGEISLLRKERPYSWVGEESDREVYNVNGYTINNFQYQHAMGFDYFYQVGNNVVHSDRFKKNVLPELDNSLSSAIAEFVDDNSLNIHKIYDQILIIRFYNKIHKDENYISAM